MGVVERDAIAGAHDEVVTAWREIVEQASSMGLADRIVIGVKLRARAEALANYEGLARGAGDLATDARAFAGAVKAQNPLTTVVAVVGVAAGVLGFFGVWSFQALRKALAPAAEAAEVGMAQTDGGVDRGGDGCFGWGDCGGGAGGGGSCAGCCGGAGEF